MTIKPQTQFDKFKEAARDLETDDEAYFDERMTKLVKHKPGQPMSYVPFGHGNHWWDQVARFRPFGFLPFRVWLIWQAVIVVIVLLAVAGIIRA